MLPWIRPNLRLNKTIAWCITGLAVVFVFFNIFFAAGIVNAQTDADTLGLQPIQNNIRLGDTDIRIIAGRLISVVLGLLGIIAFGLVLYAGFLIMTSAGNEEKVAQGKRVMVNALIGFVIIISAFAIVQFVLKSLSDAFGLSSGNQSGNNDNPEKPIFASYSGTGGLGAIIKDHYPRPNQVDVFRNTALSVTFAEPVLPESIVENTNNTCWPVDGGSKAVKIAAGACAVYTSGANSGQPIPYYGDCTDIDGDKVVSLSNECDRVKNGSVQLFFKASSTSNVEMVGITTYDEARKATIFTFKPLTLLGNEVSNVWYTAKLIGGSSNTAGIKRLNGSDIFPNNFASKFYSWSFETGTKVDLSPPYVLSTSPKNGGTIKRNIVIRIDFNEPVDPSVTQGAVGPNSNFNNIIFGSTEVKGEWRISNGYRSVEFISSESCGQNSCGEPMYCLPAPGCGVADKACTANYEGLVRTAELQNQNGTSFVAQPFTGVTDMAGNALDNGPGNKSDGVIAQSAPGVQPSWRHAFRLGSNDPKKIEVQEKNPDNFYWSFKVQNDKDMVIPYITNVKPPLEGEGVKGTEDIQIYFSRIMLYNSVMNGAGVIEYPANRMGIDNVRLEDFPYYMDLKDVGDSTISEIKHPRTFGTGGLDLYYFTYVSSTARGDNQQCLYPGRGPVHVLGQKNTSPTCIYAEDVNGVPTQNENCAPNNKNLSGSFDPLKDSACVFGINENDLSQPDVATCIEKMKAVSPSTLP